MAFFGFTCWLLVFSLDLDISVFLRLGKFLAITSSYIFSASFSLFSLWEPYSANVSILHVIQISSFCFFLYFFTVKLGWFPLLCFSACWSIPLHHLIYCWLLLVNLSLQLLYSSSLVLLYINPSLKVNFSFCSFIFSQVLWLSLWSLLWTLYQLDFLSSLLKLTWIN